MSSASSSSTSLSLIERARTQDPDAWQRMSKLYGPTVYHWARQAGLQDSDASDVVQDVFRSLAEHIRSFRQDGARGRFRGYLYSITRNKIRDHYRRAGNAPQAAGGTTANEAFKRLPEVLPTNESAACDTRLVQRALILLETDFHQQTWKAFWMQVVEDLSPAQICEELQMSPAAVYQAKSRVLRRLRDELAGMLDS